ncbi:hypothetical protein RugamoR64_33050 [Duganella rhizosphaerae]
MANKRNDNFPPDVIKVLERRVNGKCSNPDCRVPTSGPTADEKKSNNMGVAAHIKAASPGGPRYDKDMGSELRKGIGNAIWLCSNCSTIIDKDSVRYTVDLLQRWKQKAETLALEEFGKSPISRNDYQALHDVVFSKLKRSPLSSAVSDICRLSAAELERLDPRFSVDVEYKEGNTSYIFNAKNPVEIVWNVQTGFEIEFAKKFKDLVSHGKSLEIDSRAMKFEGSPLFDFSSNINGRLILTSVVRKPAITKIKLETTDKNYENSFDDIFGEVVGGTESITFSGSMFGGMYSLQLSCDFDTNGAGHTSSEINFEIWEGRSIKSLPYFDKLFQLYSAYVEEKNMCLAVEVEGRTLLSGGQVKLGNKEKCLEIYGLLRHLRNVRYILNALNLDTKFSTEVEVSYDDWTAAEEVYQYLHAYSGLVGNQIEPCKIDITIGSETNDEQAQQLTDGRFAAIKLERPCNLPLNLFGLQIANAVVSIIFTSATLRNEIPLQVLSANKNVELEIHPSSDCVVHTKITYH